MPNDKPPTITVNWRLPENMVDELGPTGIREMLERWRKSRRKLRPKNDEAALKNRCYNVPKSTVAALEREAARLTEQTGSEWSIARVVREIWRTAPSR